MTELSRRGRIRNWIDEVRVQTTAHRAELGVGGALTVSGTILILQEELLRQLLGGLPIWVLIALIVVSVVVPPVAIGAIKHVMRRTRAKAAQHQISARHLDPAEKLVGRDAEIARIKRRLKRRSVLAIRGPVGRGTSVIARKVASDLVGENTDQLLYVDVRGASKDHPESALSVAKRVLRTLGLQISEIRRAEDAGDKVGAALKEQHYVLLLDNVSSWSQVDWLPDGVQEAHVIIAGTLTGIPSDGSVAHIELASLDEQARQDLLAQHIGDERASSEPEALKQLADACMGNPRELVRVGAWLARNPRISLQTMVNDLQGTDTAKTLQFVLERSFAQLKPTARKLFTLLAELPIAELDSKAAAALLGMPSADDAIYELIDMGLVERVRNQRIRVPKTFRDSGVTEAAGRSRRQVAAWRRLVEHFAAQAAEHARRLSGAEEEGKAAEDWFAMEDQVLQQVLESAPDPRTGRALAAIGDALDTWYRFEGRDEDRLNTAALLAKAAEALKDEQLQATAELRQCSLLLAVSEVREAHQHFNKAAQLYGGVEQGPAEQHLAYATLLLAAGDDYKTVEQKLVQYGQALGRNDVLGQAVQLTNVAALLMRKGQALFMPGDEKAGDEAAHADGDVPEPVDRETGQASREEAAAEARRLYTNARIVLYQALDLAEQARDKATQAHAHELLGLAHHFLGQRHDADQHLVQAETLYGKPEARKPDKTAPTPEEQDHKVDRTGLGRCKVHRAGFLLEDPKHQPAEVAALLVEALKDLPPTGVSRALAHLHLSRLQPEQAGEHREKGAQALAPWQGTAEPQQVKVLRELLEAREAAASP
ncbi:NB-ARC domain-containing protein [Nonomuraea sp. N2-4H]|uniref:NB-ARC domain-containing protein n=1 Tax=Nonomuraea sp. N2-4H TaxID=3128898 RepID=UPI00324E43FF